LFYFYFKSKQYIIHMKNQIKNVEEFHNSFNIKNNNIPTVNVGEKIFKLRHSLMNEENEEYLDACKKGDLVEIADALGDMMYILCGTILSHGLQHKIEEVFEEIQKSNMSKLGSDGKPIYREDGKVMKGPNYFKPDIKNILS
jgi:predicted HAD superfamily Cof-like phosphohydrolase